MLRSNSTKNLSISINSKKKDPVIGNVQVNPKESQSLHTFIVKTDLLTEYRTRNGPEKFLDSERLEFVKKWVNNVNRIQTVEGKYSETLNKCSFYE